jgi:hypothetical protein
MKYIASQKRNMSTELSFGTYDKGHILKKKTRTGNVPHSQIAKQCTKLKIPQQTTWHTKTFDLISKLPQLWMRIKIPEEKYVQYTYEHKLAVRGEGTDMLGWQSRGCTARRFVVLVKF